MNLSFMIPKEKAAKAALISVAFHLAAAAILFSKPIHLHHRFFSQIGRAPSLLLEEENITVIKRNRVLEEAFSQIDFAPSKFRFASSRAVKTVELEAKPGYESLPPLEEMSLSFPPASSVSAPFLPAPPFKEEPFIWDSSASFLTFHPTMINPSMVLPSKELNLSEYGPTLSPPIASSEVPLSFHFLPSLEEQQKVSLTLPEMPIPTRAGHLNPSLEGLNYSAIDPVVKAPSEKISAAISDFTLKPHQSTSITYQESLSSLGEYGLPSLQMREWNEFFNVDIKTFNTEEGDYLFSITLVPRQDLSEYRLKQNYLFVIDRSNSVDKHQYQTYKRAVSRAISALREGDYFNIILLDATVTRLSANPIPFTKSNQQKAEEFLEKEAHGNYGAATDIYSILTKLITPIENPHEALTAILISDGDSPLKSSQQRKKINNWLEANRDRITLYTATAGHGNNLSTLKMLGLASRGFLLYSDTYAAFPRKLAKLVMDLRYPIAKEMSVSLMTQDTSAQIEILPPSSRLPYLFSDHPFILIGKTNKLTDFTLILEGKNKDQTLTIKKKILLTKAKPGSRLLTKQWTAEQAHTLFDQYLREGESSLLKQAEKQLGNDTQNSRR